MQFKYCISNEECSHVWWKSSNMNKESTCGRFQRLIVLLESTPLYNGIAILYWIVRLAVNHDITYISRWVHFHFERVSEYFFKIIATDNDDQSCVYVRNWQIYKVNNSELLSGFTYVYNRLIQQLKTNRYEMQHFTRNAKFKF